VPVLDSSVDRYLKDLRPERDPLLAEMEELAEREGVPIVHWETGRFLAILVRAIAPATVLEVGTAIGYSTLHMARAIEGEGRIVTIERDPGRAAQARGFLERNGVDGRVELIEGDALDVIRDLQGPFQMVFVDATKTETSDYLARLGGKLAERAVLVVDNLLMSGEAALAPGEETRWAADSLDAARKAARELMASGDWLGSVLPIGDGVGFAVRA
jgi:predicted O-methyltransferase YrrM